MDIALRKFIILCLTNRTITLSWGISDIRVTNDSISFNVCGSKAQTRITIRVCNNLLNVQIGRKVKFGLTAQAAHTWIDITIE